MSEITNELSQLAGYWILKRSRITAPNVGNAVQLVSYNPLRWGLFMAQSPVSGSPATAYVDVVPFSAVSISSGFILAAGTPLDFNYRNHPALVQSAWYAASPSAPNGVVEVLEEIAQQ